MPTIEEIVAAAAAEAEGTDVDAPDTDDSPEPIEPEVVDSPEPIEPDTKPDADDPPVVVDDAAKEPAKDEKAKELEALSKELEGLGVKSQKDGERENRVPRSRMVKIFGNAKKKWVAEHATELKTRDEKLTVAEKRAKDADNWDRLIATDPDRAMQALAVLHPVYKKYLGGAPAEVVKPEIVKPSALGPRPQPDAQYADGSTGYSAEGLQKLLDWNAATAREAAVTEAETRFNARFGGMEKQFQIQQVREAQRPKVEAQKAWASKTYGKLFDDDYALGSSKATEDKSEILAAMRANPDMPFGEVVAMVLTPKMQSSLQADSNKMRADIIKELNGRKKAATPLVPAATKTGLVDPNAQKTTDQIVAEALARASR